MAGGDHDWSAGEVPTAANFDDYLQLQTLQKHASASARDTALSARKREGLATIQDDTNTITVYSGSAWSSIGPVHGALNSWTPTITQSGAVTKTVTYGTYSRFGRRVEAQCFLIITGTGTSSNLITLSLPVTSVSAQDGMVIGAGHFFDTSASSHWNVHCVQANTGSVLYLSVTTSGINTSFAEANFRVGTGANAPTMALASGDTISCSIFYEAAADA